MGARPRPFLALAVALVIAAGFLVLLDQRTASSGGFVTRRGTEFFRDGTPYRFLGTNNYYLLYAPQQMTDRLLETAQRQGFPVIRTGAFLEGGAPAENGAVEGAKDGVHLYSFHNSAPAVNEGPDGLRRLDYIVYRAGTLGLKVILILTNNWEHFGGMDRYVQWAGRPFHDDFYTDPTIRGWFREYITRVATRVNSYTGIPYRDDPTIMAWELANEPRCYGSGGLPSSPRCTTETLTSWAGEMSAHLRAVAPNQLIGVGDEGYYCLPEGRTHFDNCSTGMDTIALTSLPAVDYMSLHLYAGGPQLESEAWATEWLRRHIADARRLQKPLVVGEFGYRDPARRPDVYQSWLTEMQDPAVAGALFWMLADRDEKGSPYPDFDGYTVYCPGAVCDLLAKQARAISGRSPGLLPWWPLFRL